MDLYVWLNKSYSFYVAAVVSIFSRHGLTNDAHYGNQPNKGKLEPHMPSIYLNNCSKRLYISSIALGWT